MKREEKESSRRRRENKRENGSKWLASLNVKSLSVPVPIEREEALLYGCNQYLARNAERAYATDAARSISEQWREKGGCREAILKYYYDEKPS